MKCQIIWEICLVQKKDFSLIMKLLMIRRLWGIQDMREDCAKVAGNFLPAPSRAEFKLVATQRILNANVMWKVRYEESSIPKTSVYSVFPPALSEANR
jgi:hypothetical protein